jgi:DNA-binding XRE family transcriptional regulator
MHESGVRFDLTGWRALCTLCAMVKFDIRTLREKLGWTQDHLAEYLGVDRSSISRMEHGQPARGPVLRLLAALEADVAKAETVTETACDPP